jgi:hypothetical protein
MAAGFLISLIVGFVGLLICGFSVAEPYKTGQARPVARKPRLPREKGGARHVRRNRQLFVGGGDGRASV